MTDLPRRPLSFLSDKGSSPGWPSSVGMPSVKDQSDDDSKKPFTAAIVAKISGVVIMAVFALCYLLQIISMVRSVSVPDTKAWHEFVLVCGIFMLIFYLSVFFWYGYMKKKVSSSLVSVAMIVLVSGVGVLVELWYQRQAFVDPAGSARSACAMDHRYRNLILLMGVFMVVGTFQAMVLLFRG